MPLARISDSMIKNECIEYKKKATASQQPLFVKNQLFNC